jgi:hypothetical protein
MNMKKIFIFTMAALLVAGCSSENDEPEKEDSPKKIEAVDKTVYHADEFAAYLRYNESGKEWVIQVNTEEKNPFPWGDELGVHITVGNFQEDFRQYQDQRVVLSGSYQQLYSIVIQSGLASVIYYTFNIETIRLWEEDKPEEKQNALLARYQVAKMTITTDGGAKVDSKEKADYRACTIKIESDTAVWNYEGRGRIRGRGNSTWLWYPKKPYRIKLDEKASILGMAEEKDWVLLANYRDPTHLMNTFVFAMGQGLGVPYTNTNRYVEVTLNGDYIGLYQLTEQVEQGKSRVNINSKKGWLLSLDVDDGPAESPNAGDNFWSSVYRMPVCVKSPETEDYATPEMLIEDAKKALGDLENIIRSHDYEALAKVCDIPVMIDYLLIQEYIYNVELSAPRSIYIHKDKDADSKWTFGPLWDFDAGYDFDWSQMTTGHKFFSDYRETVLGTDPANHVSDYTYTPSFFTDMWKNKQFVSEVKNRWNALMPRIMSEFWPEAKRYADAAAEAMERDAKRWPIDKDYKTEINRMEKWLNSRAVYMDNIVRNYPYYE